MGWWRHPGTPYARFTACYTYRIGGWRRSYFICSHHLPRCHQTRLSSKASGQARVLPVSITRSFPTSRRILSRQFETRSYLTETLLASWQPPPNDHASICPLSHPRNRLRSLTTRAALYLSADDSPHPGSSSLPRPSSAKTDHLSLLLLLHLTGVWALACTAKLERERRQAARTAANRNPRPGPRAGSPHACLPCLASFPLPPCSYEPPASGLWKSGHFMISCGSGRKKKDTAAVCSPLALHSNTGGDSRLT